jgi:glycolate oxidase subunit GlcD
LEKILPEPLTKKLGDRLRGVVGDAWVIAEADRLLAYESDGLTAYRKTPRAVVLPRDTDEVSCVLGILSQAGVPAVPRGAGTGLSGGALADGDAVVVGTARMTDMLALDPDNRLARVQPGMINANLTTAVEPFGLYYAPDPSSQSACTLGGNVAENSGGPHCLKYGVTSRYVTGLTVVTYEGKIVELGGFGRESGGYDLLGLFVGSEGCFGIATEIEVRLLPRPEGVRTLLAIFDRLGDAGSAVTEIMAEGLLPAALEIIDGPTIRAVEASVFAAGFPTDAEAALVIEFDGIEAGLASDVERAVVQCRAAGAREVRIADSEEERLALWKGRKKAFGAMGQIANDLMVQDGTVPRSKLTEVLGRISEIGARHDLTIANVFHAGDGNLHPNLLFDRSDPEELSRVDRASTEIMAVCVEAGGTITGEHGVGLDKRRYMSLVHNADELDAMRRVKAVFDPLGRMNPGKVLPDSPDSAGAAP